MQKFKCKGQEKIGGRNHPLKVLPMQGRSGDKIAARTERTTRKPRMGHAMATAGRGPRLLRRGGLLSVCRPVAPNWLLYCVAPQHSLSEALGDGDEAMSHQYILDKMSSVENTSLALAQMEEVSTFISLLPDPDRISDMCFPLKRRTVTLPVFAPEASQPRRSYP